MFAKVLLAVLVSLSFSVNSFAAGTMNKAEASIRLNKEGSPEKKAKEDLEKLKNIEFGKMNKDQQQTVSKALSVFSDKIGVSNKAMLRVFLLKSDILADVIRLESVKGTEAQKVQSELIESIGTTLTAENSKSTEVQAAVKLLQLDLTTLPPKATEIVKKINELIRQGKTLKEAITEGTKGMKGSLEDLIKCE
jgi:hypothetical protein